MRPVGGAADERPGQTVAATYGRRADTGTEELLEAEQLLRIVRWASGGAIDATTGRQNLEVDLGPRPLRMAHSRATGEELVSNGFLGADVIRLGAGEGFVPHTHPGDHLLVVIGGLGTITYDGRVYPTAAGEVYLVEGGVPHGVGARTEHVILAVGAPHRTVGSSDRMTPVSYEAVLAEMANLTCQICGLTVEDDERLHSVGCSHCPCFACIGAPEPCP